MGSEGFNSWKLPRVLQKVAFVAGFGETEDSGSNLEVGIHTI